MKSINKIIPNIIGIYKYTVSKSNISIKNQARAENIKYHNEIQNENIDNIVDL
jgi:hypothetical protein